MMYSTLSALKRTTRSLEAQLLAQVQHVLRWLAGLVRWGLDELLLEYLLDELLRLDTAIRRVHLLVCNEGLCVELGWHRVARGHEVVVVDVLDERLHFGALSDFLLGHLLGDFQGGLVDARDEGMAEGPRLAAVVERLHDDGLPACVAAVENHN